MSDAVSAFRRGLHPCPYCAGSGIEPNVSEYTNDDSDLLLDDESCGSAPMFTSTGHVVVSMSCVLAAGHDGPHQDSQGRRRL